MSTPTPATCRALARPATLALVLALFAVDPARAGGDTTCARDLLVANSMQRQAVDQLESAGEDEATRCRIWRRHVETMRRIAGVFGRCMSGPERKERIAQVQASEAEFGALTRSRCQAR